MAFSDDDKKEVLGIINEALGLEEGKKLSEVLSESMDAKLNSYDKRTRKEREQTSATLSQIQETLKGISAKRDDEESNQSSSDDPDLSKLPDAVKQQLEAMKAANEKLAKQFEASEKARKEQEEQAKIAAAKQADRDLRDAIRAAGISKEVGLDPEAIDFVVAHLHGDRVARGESSLVRINESGRYEMAFGEDRVTNEPIWKPLPEAMKGWAQTTIGKRFLPAVPGGGVAPPNGARPNGGARKTIQDFTAEDFAGKSAEEVIAMTKDVSFE